MQEAGRIWPVWTRSVGAMIEAGAIVRFACTWCMRVYDVDLETLAILKGRAWSLVDRRARCKASGCRKSGRFVASLTMNTPFLWLHASEQTPNWIVNTRPCDHEPPGEGGPPPCPVGADPKRWALASERERKKMVERLRS